VANFGANTVSSIDTSTDHVVQTLTVGNAPSSLAFNEDGTLLFVANYCDKTISLVDTSGDQDAVITTLPLATDDAYPFDLATFTDNDFYTKVFVAKEYFTPRPSKTCTSLVKATTLDLSILAVQGQSASVTQIEPPVQKSLLQRFFNFIAELLRRILGIV
jgi:YVTN family beta-propeller protein